MSPAQAALHTLKFVMQALRTVGGWCQPSWRRLQCGGPVWLQLSTDCFGKDGHDEDKLSIFTPYTYVQAWPGLASACVSMCFCFQTLLLLILQPGPEPASSDDADKIRLLYLLDDLQTDPPRLLIQSPCVYEGERLLECLLCRPEITILGRLVLVQFTCLPVDCVQALLPSTKKLALWCVRVVHTASSSSSHLSVRHRPKCAGRATSTGAHC